MLIAAMPASLKHPPGSSYSPADLREQDSQIICTPARPSSSVVLFPTSWKSSEYCDAMDTDLTSVVR